VYVGILFVALVSGFKSYEKAAAGKALKTLFERAILFFSTT